MKQEKDSHLHLPDKESDTREDDMDGVTKPELSGYPGGSGKPHPVEHLRRRIPRRRWSRQPWHVAPFKKKRADPPLVSSFEGFS